MKFAVILLVFAMSLFSVFAVNDTQMQCDTSDKYTSEVEFKTCLKKIDGTYTYVQCGVHELDKNVAFGEIEVDCGEKKVIKQYNKPIETQPEVREKKYIKHDVVEEKTIDVSVVDKNKRFGEDMCVDCNEVVIQQYNKPFDTQPQSLSNKIISFIIDCFDIY